MALDAAVVLQDAENRVAARQVGARGVGAPEGQRPRRFAQHEEPGGVIDLRIDQHDGGDGAVAPRARLLQIGIVTQLLLDVG